jgi:hypothetical protein
MTRLEVRDFDGDLDALADLAGEAWSREYGAQSWPNLYRPAVTGHLFADVPDPRFLVGAYVGARLVAFLANLPRVYRHRGRQHRAVYTGLLVADREYRGASAYLIAESLKRNQDYGADFALMTLQAGHSGLDMVQKALAPRFRVEVLRTMGTLVHAVDFEQIVHSEGLHWYEVAAIRLLGAHRSISAPDVPGTVRAYRDDDLVQILALTGLYDDSHCLVRQFDEASLARRLRTEGLTNTAVYERDGLVRGFVNFTAYDLVSVRQTCPWAWVDFLYWEGLCRAEQVALLSGLWRLARDAGCVGILEWSKGYYSTVPLLAAHFIPYPRFLKVAAWVFHPQLSLRGATGMVEQQL